MNMNMDLLAGLKTDAAEKNITFLLTEWQRIQAKNDVLKNDEDEYQNLVKDIWIGCILTLIVVSCIICSCSFFAYHKFQTWKRHCKYKNLFTKKIA